MSKSGLQEADDNGVLWELAIGLWCTILSIYYTKYSVKQLKRQKVIKTNKRSSCVTQHFRLNGSPLNSQSIYAMLSPK